MIRCSDERLRELIDFVENDVSAQYASDWAGNNFLCQEDEARWSMVLEVSRCLHELLDLRAKLSAGPVMPGSPSDAVWISATDAIGDATIADAALVAAARKALGVMKALGWHIAAAGDPETENEAIERAAAQEAYDELADALGVSHDHS